MIFSDVGYEQSAEVTAEVTGISGNDKRNMQTAASISGISTVLLGWTPEGSSD